MRQYCLKYTTRFGMTWHSPGQWNYDQAEVLGDTVQRQQDASLGIIVEVVEVTPEVEAARQAEQDRTPRRRGS